MTFDEDTLSRFGIKNYPLLKTVLENCTYERGVRGLTLLIELAPYFPLGSPRQQENEFASAVSIARECEITLLYRLISTDSYRWVFSFIVVSYKQSLAVRPSETQIQRLERQLGH